MKSEIEKIEQGKFPKLMKLKHDTKNTIMFFEKPERGMIVFTDDESRLDTLGEIYLNHKMDCFEDFHGKITLSN